MIPWEHIEADQQYQSLSVEDQGIVKSEWFKDNISNTADFKKLSEQDRLYVINGFFANDISDPDPEGSIWGDIPKSLVRGLDSVGEAIGGVMEMAHIPGGTWVKELYQQRGARPEVQKPKYLQDGTVIEHPERLVDVRWWVNLVGENIPNLATMMAPGAGAYKFGKAAKLSSKAVKRLSMGGAMAGGFTVEAGAAYNDAKDEMLRMGYDEKTAQGMATLEGVIVGTVNSLLEAAPFHVLLKNPGAKKGFTRMIRQALFEGGTEMVQENVNMVAAELGHKPNRKWNEWLGRTIESGLGGFAIGGGLGMFGGGEAVKDEKQTDKAKTIEPKKASAELYKEKIVDALKAGTITVDELQERKSSENFTPEQVAIFDEAISEFQAGKPNVPDIQEKPIQEIKTETQKDEVQFFVNRIMSGEKMETPEDLQFYENNKDEIERRLQESMSEKDEGLFPQQTKEEQDAIEAEILRQRKAKPPLTGEVPGQKVDRQKQQDEINRIKARRALQTLAPIWDSLGDQEKQVAAELILPKGQEVEVEVERKAKEEIRTAQPDERIEAQRQLKEAERLGLKLDADERKRLEAMVAEPKQMKPEGKRAEIDYSELTKTGEWVEPSEPTQAKKREPEQPQDEVAETVPPKKTAQVIGLKTSEKDQRPKPYPFDQTIDEYLESEYQRYLNSKPLGKETDFNAWKASDRGKTAAMDHEMAVRDAVKRGVTVRERVLKEYPDLAPKEAVKLDEQVESAKIESMPKKQGPGEIPTKEQPQKPEGGSLTKIEIERRIAKLERERKKLSKQYDEVPRKNLEYRRLDDKIKNADDPLSITDDEYKRHGELKNELGAEIFDRAADKYKEIEYLNKRLKVFDKKLKPTELKEGTVQEKIAKNLSMVLEEYGLKPEYYDHIGGKIPAPFVQSVRKIGNEWHIVSPHHIPNSIVMLGVRPFVESAKEHGYNVVVYQKPFNEGDPQKVLSYKDLPKPPSPPEKVGTKPPRAEKAETKQEKDGAPTPKKVDKKAAKLLNTLKDETGSSELANDILRKAADLIIDGVETFGRFRREMQKAFKSVWDKIKKHMRALWDVVKSYQPSAMVNQRGEIKIEPVEKKQPQKKTADDILKDIFAEPKVKKRVKEKKKFDKELRKDTEDVLKHVSNLKHIRKFIRPGKLTRQGKQDLSYMWDLMLSVPEFFKQKIGAAGRIYQAQQDRMDEYHEHIHQMENHDKINVVESLKRLKKDRAKARQVKKYLVDADRTGIGFHTKLENKFWTVYNPKNESVGEYESNTTPDNVDRGETEAIAEMVKAEAEYLAEQGFTPEQIESITAFRLTTNKGFELLFRSMRNLMKKHKEAGLKEPELKTFEDGKPKTISLKEAMAIMGDMRGTYYPRIRQSGKYILTAIKGDDRILRTFKTPNMREYIKSKYEAQGYTVETKPSGQLGEDVFDLSGDLVKTQQIIMAAMEKAEKVLSGPWVEGKTELTEEIDKVTEEIQAVFLNAVSEQVANIIRGRGSRVHMTRRNPEVWKGYEEDPEIAIAKYIRGLSGGEAKRNASIKMLQALTGTDISFEDFQKIEKAKGNTVDRTDYMGFVRDRMIDARQQKNAFKWAKAYISEMTRNREMADEVIGFVKGLAVGKYLAFRVFSAPLVNITALPTSVVATLKGAGIPYRQAWRYTARALKTYRQYLQHKKGKFIPKEDQVIFKTIIEKGWDNPQFSSESMQTLRSQLGKTWDKVIDVGMWTFDQSERLNRVATIYAAYKGLKNIHKDKSASQLLDMAKELSDKSHGVYNKGNHPYVALGNNPAAKLAQMFYVFRTFSHTYLLNMKRLGLDKQWGAVAHMAVMPAVLAGAGASVMTPIISGLLKAFGLADEPEEEMYAKIAESFGPEAEAWARHGLVGLGGRGASIKGSLAIGIGDLPTKIEDLFGASGSIGKDIYYGAKSLARGDVMKGAEKWSPTGIGNILRGYREYNEGLTTWNNAPKFYGTEPLKASKSEAFMRVLSLSPARLAGITEKQWKERRVEEKYRQWRTDIYAKIKRYILGDGDDEQWAKIIAEIIKFNEQADRWNLSPITPKTIRMNIKRMYRISKREKLRR